MKRIRALLLTIGLGWAGSSAAGILGDMSAMFMSNSTASGTIQTKDRVGVFGGSFSMRAPVTSVNLVAFDPPRIDAGCGGIDLYGGSFTFINSQQLVALFRKVAANAVGLAFKAAIKAISPSLDALLTEFQTLLQNMNNLAKNSCHLAHLVVDPVERSVANAVHGDGSVGSTSSNIFSDATSALEGFLHTANSFFEKQGEVNPKSGNQVVKAALGSGAASIMGFAGIPNVDGSGDDASDPNSLNNQILVSVLGYDISGVPCTKTNAAGTADTSASTANSSLGQIVCSGPGRITLDDLVKGGGTGSTRPNVPLQLYRCENPSGYGTPDGGFDPQVCTKMKTINFNYSGIQGWVNTMLFGNADPGLGVMPGSIVGLFNSGTSVGVSSSATGVPTLSTGQIQFMNQAGVPLVPLLTRTSNPATRISIAQRLSPYIVDCVAARMGEALYKGANEVQNSNGYELSDDVKKRIADLRSDYLAKQFACLSDNRVYKVVVELNEATRLRAGNIK